MQMLGLGTISLVAGTSLSSWNRPPAFISVPALRPPEQDGSKRGVEPGEPNKKQDGACHAVSVLLHDEPVRVALE